jgi:hypothetical protein
MAVKHKLDLSTAGMFYAKIKMSAGWREKHTNGICLLLALILLPALVQAQYKDYVRKETKKVLFLLSFDKENITVSLPDEAENRVFSAKRKDISTAAGEVQIAQAVKFTAQGLKADDELIPYEKISDVLVSSENDITTIQFFEVTSLSSGSKKMREGNVETFSDSITIEKEQFIRGLVLSVKGPITVHGEVNKDVISLFGDVNLVTGSVVRGNILSITGKILVEKNASIYGEIYSGVREYESHRFRFYRDNEFEIGVMLDYNRIDGLTLGTTAGYLDGDSSLPSVEIGIGYAMESQRPRHFIKAAQLLSRENRILLGASYYRKLASQDDWLLGNAENAVFVILATEDFKDYYESEGIMAWVELSPIQRLKLKAAYQFDDTRWLQAKTHLWSLFGGSKLFRENFSSVDESYRTTGAGELDALNTGSIHITAEYDSRDVSDDLANSGWNFGGNFEWSNKDFGSDYEYRRYSIAAVRYQHLTKYSSIKARWRFANSDGLLPMYKRYYLGGLGTMRGYEHKEFMGSRYWLANVEFWLQLPKLYDLNLIPFWDICQIANDAKLDDNIEIKNDLGIGVKITAIRLDLAKRLDGSLERELQIFLRFAKSF